MLVRLLARSRGGRSSREPDEVFAIGLSSEPAAQAGKSIISTFLNFLMSILVTYEKTNDPLHDYFPLGRRETSRVVEQGIS